MYFVNHSFPRKVSNRNSEILWSFIPQKKPMGYYCTIAPPSLAAASSQKLYFEPLDYLIRTTQKMIFFFLWKSSNICATLYLFPNLVCNIILVLFCCVHFIRHFNRASKLCSIQFHSVCIQKNKNIDIPCLYVYIQLVSLVQKLFAMSSTH